MGPIGALYTQPESVLHQNSITHEVATREGLKNRKAILLWRPARYLKKNQKVNRLLYQKGYVK